MTPIDMGDGTGTLGQGGLRNVSTFIGAIPDSVVYQWRTEDFADPWPSNIGNSEMSISGLTASGDLVSGDGNDDHGLASGPETLPTNETHGVAFTFGTTVSSVSFAWGMEDADNTRFQLRVQDDGAIRITYDDGTNGLEVATDTAFNDGTVRACVINKSGNAAADIDIYVGDMSTAVTTSTLDDAAFDHTQYSPASQMGYWARNNEGTPDLNIDADQGVFEFNSEPYSQSDREGFVSRRSEV